MDMEVKMWGVLRVAFFYCTGVVCFLTPGLAGAASLYISPNTVDMYRGDTRSFAVRLDVDEEQCVNVVDATLHYSDSIRVIDVSRGDSILSLWLEDPVVDEETRTITFAGGIPNGYCGRIQGDPRLTNVIVELIVRVPGFSVGREDDTAAIISFDQQTKAYLNDGQGTEAPLSTFDATIYLSKQPGASTTDTWAAEVNADTRPPEAFSIELVEDDTVFSGKYFIVFNSTDKQSGIDHYEVIEERIEDDALFRWGSSQAPWVETKSPYVLKDQGLRSVIRVRAIDKAGNERIATLIPDESLRKSYLFINVLILISALAILCVILLLSYRHLRRRHAKKAIIASENRNVLTSEKVPDGDDHETT